MPERRYYPVPNGFAGDRVDAVLARLTGLSRHAAAKVIDDGDVWLDGIAVRKSDRVAADQMIEIVVPDPPNVTPVPTDEDDDVVVVDKPAGLAAHPSLNFDGPDVLGALMGAGVQLSAYGPAERKGIVHRLDVGTSGAMVVAKSELAYTELKQAFRDRTVEKIYHALVQGHPDPLRGTIDAPIGRDHRHQWKMGIREDGRHSVTHYEVIEAMAGASLVEVHLETGRTHQIRVHMAHLHFPLLGDPVYGGRPRLPPGAEPCCRAAIQQFRRQALHAGRLALTHPGSGERLEWRAEIPADLAALLTILEQDAGGARE